MALSCFKTWTIHHVTVFLLTFCTYSLFHATRKTFSDIKDPLSKEWTPVSCNSSWPCLKPAKLWTDRRLFDSYSDAEPFLGILDTLFLSFYAVGLYISGIIGDRFELRLVISLGMTICSVLLFSFGVLTEWLHFYNEVFYAVFWSLQGLIQSVGWPACVAVMANWFGKSNRGLIFGIWSSCASVGNIIGNSISAALVDDGYEFAFLCTSLMMLGGAMIIYFGLVSSPIDLRLPPPEEEVNLDDSDYSTVPIVEDTDETEIVPDISPPVTPVEKEKALTFWQAIMLPGVIPYSLGYACLKLVNYAFFFWLPYYLTNNFNWDDSLSDTVSTWYDVGGIVGGIVFGMISDRMKARSPVLVLMLAASPFALWGYKQSPNNILINSVLMTVVGVLINGASNIISAAVTADLGKQKVVGKNSRAMATVTGIVDGTGSIGAAVGQYLVASIQKSLGWNWVFNFFIIINVVCLLCLLPMLANDLKLYSCTQYLLAKMKRARSASS